MLGKEKICEDIDCTGCGLCENICPVYAISMKADQSFGHKRPVIDPARCIECGQCERKCPANNPVTTNSIRSAFAAWQVNDEKHYSSSSGGIAAALYEKYLDIGGWIAGVRVGERQEPEFMLSNNFAQIQEFKGSKYVQPIIGTIYRDVLEKLRQGKQVVFIGLPCQCAAMKRYAEVVKADKLLLVDMVCHGVPSFEAFKAHLEKIENRTQKKATKIYFRDKATGVGLILEDNNSCFYKRYLHEDVFMHSFISGDLFPENCYRCRYACSERVGDLTICDFWGIGKLAPFKHKMSRVSAVLINTAEGQKGFDLIQDIIYAEERLILEVIEGNEQLREPSQKGLHRDELLTYMQDGKLSQGLHKIYGSELENKYCRRWVKDQIKTIANSFGIVNILEKRKNNGR